MDKAGVPQAGKFPPSINIATTASHPPEPGAIPLLGGGSQAVVFRIA